ncbi:MAG: hypothetical protein IPJ13_18435 [Saprospiraceae bacterium]|nr:hypothetical protein [Saprospiraceae bacterium]
MYYDTCGNAAMTSAVFDDDTIHPVIDSCPQSITVSVSENSCQTEITLNIPTATDNCIESRHLW